MQFMTTEEPLSQFEPITEIEEYYRIIAENPMLGIAWGTCDGKVVYANRVFCDLLEMTPDEVKGLHFSQFTHPDDYAKELALFQQLQSGEIDSYLLEKRYVS